jgi:hypothetical protein
LSAAEKSCRDSGHAAMLLNGPWLCKKSTFRTLLRMIFSIEQVTTCFTEITSSKSKRLRSKFYFGKMLASFHAAKTLTGRLNGIELQATVLQLMITSLASGSAARHDLADHGS